MNLNESKHPIRQAALNALIDHHREVYPGYKHVVIVFPSDPQDIGEVTRCLLLEDTMRLALNLEAHREG
jgi:hypothetical protein